MYILWLSEKVYISTVSNLKIELNGMSTVNSAGYSLTKQTNNVYIRKPNELLVFNFSLSGQLLFYSHACMYIRIYLAT